MCFLVREIWNQERVSAGNELRIGKASISTLESIANKRPQQERCRGLDRHRMQRVTDLKNTSDMHAKVIHVATYSGSMHAYICILGTSRGRKFRYALRNLDLLCSRTQAQ